MSNQPNNVIAFPGRSCPGCGDSRFLRRCLACGFEPSIDFIQAGMYVARYERYGCSRSFGTWKLWIDLYLPTEGVTLRRWYGLADYRDGRILAGYRSHLVRELSDALDLRIGPHITEDFIHALKGKYLRARVAMVVKDFDGKPLSRLNQYPKIEAMLPERSE